MTFCRKVQTASGQTPVHQCSSQVSSRHWVMSHVTVTHCMCSSRAMKYIAYSLTWLLISDSRSPTYLPCPDTRIVHKKSTWWRPSNLDLPMLHLYTFTMSIHYRDWLTQILTTFVQKPMETGRPGQGTSFDWKEIAWPDFGNCQVWDMFVFSIWKLKKLQWPMQFPVYSSTLAQSPMVSDFPWFDELHFSTNAGK